MLDLIMNAPDSTRSDFAELVAGLAVDPSHAANPGASIMPLADVPGGWSASFDDGLLAFRVLADYPIVELKDVLWLE